MYDTFVISPLTDDDPYVVEERYQWANQYIAYLSNQDLIAYSAISAMYHVAKTHDLPTTYDYWKKQCITMMSMANEVHVLCLPGWQLSKGVADEIATSKTLNKPITFIEPHNGEFREIE